MLFLTYIQGTRVNEWVIAQHRWLVDQVSNNGVLPTNVALWTTLERNFRRNFANTLEQEQAQAILKKGFKMTNEDIDGYIARFELLTRQARYHLDSPQTLDLFTSGLPRTLYVKIYEMDNPQTYVQWKDRALERQRQWIHIKSQLNNFRTTPAPRTQNNWGPRYNSVPRFNSRDPNAMDTSPGRINARVNTTSPPTTWRGNSTQVPRGGGRNNNFDIREVTCYRCGVKGHMSRDCPQQTWNRGGTSRGNNFRGRGGGGPWRGNSRNNARATRAEEDNNTEYYDAEPGPEDFQVARAIAGTDEERSQQWLAGVAGESDAVKDIVLQSLWKNEDFRGA
jgi:hypothetical protein